MTLETVVVTAQKHTELLSKAPVAISAVSQQGLDKLSITTAQDLVSTVPNLQTSVNGYSTQFQIRGIGNNSGSYSVVATQVDGVYQANPASLNAGLYDVSRIEVARGPQGTVYGRNATAGVVNILTHDPEKEFQLFGDIAYGNYNDITTRAVINVPVTDKLAMRASVVRQSNDGYYPRGAAPDKYDSKDILSGQVTFLANITDDLTWRVAVEHSENTGTLRYLHAINYVSYPNANLATGQLGTGVVQKARSNLFNQEAVTDNALRIQENALRSRLTWAATDEFSITYLAGVSSMVNNGMNSATGVFWSFSKGTETQSMSHEIDFNYDTSKVKAVLGLYHYWDNTSGFGGLHIGNTVPAPLAGYVSAARVPLNNPVGNEPSSYGLIDIAQQTKKNGNQSEAIFGQVTYSVLEDLRLTAGMRFTKDWHNVDTLQTVCLFNSVKVTSSSATCSVPFGPPAETYQANKSSNVSWRFGADYDVSENQLLYASVSTGYRAGGVSGNAQLPKAFLTYQPERVTNYEAGWKSELLNRSLGLSLAVFNMDYTNMQVQAIQLDLNGNPTPVTINAAKARIKGAEFEWNWRITSADTITGYATYLDARFSSFPNAVNSTVNPDGVYNSTVAGKPGFAQLATNVPYNFTGNYLPNAPQETIRIAYSHVFDLGDDGTFTPSLQFFWQDTSYNDFANNPQAIRKPYTKSDLNLTYQSANERLTVEGYIHNLENRPVWQIMNAKWDDTQGYLYPPRTYGIRLGYKLY
ncbi:TonB-dependent receptor [Rhizomicrobium palustre]